MWPCSMTCITGGGILNTQNQLAFPLPHTFGSDVISQLLLLYQAYLPADAPVKQSWTQIPWNPISGFFFGLPGHGALSWQ